MKLNPEKFRPFDPANYIKTDTTRAIYMEECLKTGDVSHIVDALSIIARSLGMTKIEKQAEAMRDAIDESQGKEGIPNLEVFLGMMAALDLEFSVNSEGVVKKKAATKARTKSPAKALAKTPAKSPAKRQKEMASATA